MSLGEIFTAKVENIVSGGAGIVHHNGQPVFIAGTAPDDIVSAKISAEKKGWAKAELLKIEEASSFRTEALCPLYGKCGGCNLQHIRYENQLEIKADILKQAFSRIGKISELPNININPSEPFEYRNRMQFHRVEKMKAGKPSVGLKMKESDTIIPIVDCPIADPGIRSALQSLSLKPPVSKDRFTVYSKDDVFLCEGNMEQSSVTIKNKKISMDVKVFFQSNGKILEKLIDDLINVMKNAHNKHILGDFYSGLGTFSVYLQDYFEEIDLLEQNKEAISLARRNLSGKKAEYYALSDDQWVSLMKKKSRQYSAIVIDPPRVGLSSAMRLWLCENGPQLLAYVSCDPASLARDSRELIEKGGYVLHDLHLYDFYPQTAHIESLSVFIKGD
jgi:23S rRNA (uracil1939-C5)-methyltransferase